jgi:hypothetical protein
MAPMIAMISVYLQRLAEDGSRNECVIQVPFVKVSLHDLM